LAPPTFGAFGGDILVGNFGNGRIHAYDPASGELQGTLSGPNGGPVAIDGLWGLRFARRCRVQGRTPCSSPPASTMKPTGSSDAVPNRRNR
jgi:hypothetical protein